MSLDDFVITFFTKGPGFNTLSTKIYTEVRKGIKPEMYALSTLLFLSVLALLIIINRSPSKRKAERKDYFSSGKKFFRTGIVVLLAIAYIFILFGYSKKSDANKIYVYNWGEYIDPEVITLFEEETGLDVVYDEFESNEEMYPKIETGAVQYDVVCPSDYMIQRMINENLLAVS
jgi:spermidine/putrescine transport system permease protein